MVIDNTFGMKYFPIISPGATHETNRASGKGVSVQSMDSNGGVVSPYMPDIPLPRSIEASASLGDFGKEYGFKSRLISVKA